MSKLGYENIINLYKEKMCGMSYSDLSAKYKIRDSRVKYLVRLINKHGHDILIKNKNKKYPKYFKLEAIERVIVNNESLYCVALDYWFIK